MFCNYYYDSITIVITIMYYYYYALYYTVMLNSYNYSFYPHKLGKNPFIKRTDISDASLHA